MALEGNRDRKRDEADFVDLWIAVSRYRALIAAFILSGMVSGLLWVIFMPKHFEYRLVLEVGGVWIEGSDMSSVHAEKFQFLEKPESVITKILESYSREAADSIERESRSFQMRKDLEANLENDGIVGITLEARREWQKDALLFLSEISRRVLSDHNDLLSERVELLRRLARERLDELDRQLKTLIASRESVLRSDDPAAKGLTMLMIDSHLQEVATERQLVERQLKVQLSANVRPSRILVGPIREIEPVGLDPYLVFILATLFGAALAVLAIAILEVNANARSRLERREFN